MYRDVAIVGCGPAGLAAAWALAGAGARVTLYDRQPQPGGRLRTDVLDGTRADVAVQLLGSHYRETFRLAREAGAGDRLVRAPGRDALWRGGRAHTLTYGSVSSMATSSALPTALKLRLAARYLPFLQRHAGTLDVNAPVAAAVAGLDRESIAEWGRREMGDDFVELLAYPQLAAYYAATPEDTTAAYYHALARAGLDVAVYGVRGGMGELARALIGALEPSGARFVGGTEVREVRAGPAGVELAWDDGGARHDAAVVAVPGPAAAGIVELAGPARAWFAGVRSLPAVSVALVVDAPLDVNFFGLSIPRSEPPGDVLAAVCIQEGKRAGLAGPDNDIVVVYPAPAAIPAILAASPDQALATVLPAVERVVPALRGRVVRAKVYRFPEGGAAFYPGYLRHLAAFDPGWLPPRVALAGDYLVAPTVEGAVRSGLNAGRRLLGR
ncbi:MAG TPA: FAD-dependent oxidoreductase [Longimicrobiales bacterium]